VKKAAERLGVSPATVYGLCAAKKIRHERHGLGAQATRARTSSTEADVAAATAGVDLTANGRPCSPSPPPQAGCFNGPEQGG
jgi:hypothetical protein